MKIRLEDETIWRLRDSLRISMDLIVSSFLIVNSSKPIGKGVFSATKHLHLFHPKLKGDLELVRNPSIHSIVQTCVHVIVTSLSPILLVNSPLSSRVLRIL